MPPSFFRAGMKIVAGKMRKIVLNVPLAMRKSQIHAMLCFADGGPLSRFSFFYLSREAMDGRTYMFQGLRRQGTGARPA